MGDKAKRRMRYAVPAVLALLVVSWILGNLLLDVHVARRHRGRNKIPVYTPAGASLRDIFETFPLKGGQDSRVELLEGNVESWVARWRLLGEARQSVDVSYFILHQDIFGLSFLGHLLQKAREGVRIRIQLDALGTRMSLDVSGNDYLDTLVAIENVSVKIYRPWFFRFTDAILTLKPIALAASDHDKSLIVNGQLALTGGRNIGAEYFADLKDDPKAFRDLDVVLAGNEIGRSLTAVFEANFKSGEARSVNPESVDIVDWGNDLLLAYHAMDAWLRGRPIPEQVSSSIRSKGFSWLDDLAKLPRLRGALNRRPAGSIAAETRLIDSRPRLLESGDPISVSLLRLLQTANREIVLQTPYLVLPEEIVPVFENTAARGVRITVLTNSPVSSDSAPSQAFFLEQWPEILARVPTLRLFVCGDRHNLHTKAGAIDGRLMLFGTYNIDPFSMAVSGEVVVAAWSEPLALRFAEQTRRLIARGPPVIYEYRIARDAQGRPQRDKDGKVIVAFGPEHHSDPEQWKSVKRLWTLLRVAKKVPGTSRLLWTK